MNGKNSKAISISFRVDEGVVEHNNRDFIAKNVTKSEQKKPLRVKELIRAYEKIAEATIRVVHSDHKIRRDTEIGMISLYLF